MKMTKQSIWQQIRKTRSQSRGPVQERHDDEVIEISDSEEEVQVVIDEGKKTLEDGQEQDSNDTVTSGNGIEIPESPCTSSASTEVLPSEAAADPAPVSSPAPSGLEAFESFIDELYGSTPAGPPTDKPTESQLSNSTSVLPAPSTSGTSTSTIHKWDLYIHDSTSRTSTVHTSVNGKPKKFVIRDIEFTSSSSSTEIDEEEDKIEFERDGQVTPQNSQTSETPKTGGKRRQRRRLLSFEDEDSKEEEKQKNSDRKRVCRKLSLRSSRRKVNQEQSESESGSDAGVPVASRLRGGRKNQKILSDNDSSDQDDVPSPSVSKNRRIRKKRQVTFENDDDRGSASPSLQENPGPSRASKRRIKSKKKRRVVSNDDDESTPANSQETPGPSKPPKRRTTKRLRSATATPKGTSKKEQLMEVLKEKIEKRRNKELRKKSKSPSPTHGTPSASDKEKEDDNQSDEGSYSSSGGSSPCPIVPDDEPIKVYYDTDTPSESSVTTDGEVDEVPDLGSGSEGEKELTHEISSDDEENEQSDRSCDSSDDGPADDGQNDSRCLLCKNLGEINVTGRAYQEDTSWCKCGECGIISDTMDSYDLICCKEIKGVADFLQEELDDDVCVTHHSRFKSDVLEFKGYARAISKGNEFGHRFGGGASAFFEYTYSKNAARERMYNNALERFRGCSRFEKYCESLVSFIYWIFDRINHDMVIPACVIKKVHEAFAGPDEDFFFRFLPESQCERARCHCKLAKQQ